MEILKLHYSSDDVALDEIHQVFIEKQGLQVQDYFGNFHKGTPTDLDLPAVCFSLLLSAIYFLVYFLLFIFTEIIMFQIDCDKTVMVTFKHDEKLQDASQCCFQVCEENQYLCLAFSKALVLIDVEGQKLLQKMVA